MYTHVLDHSGKTVFEQDLPAEPQVFLDAVKPFRDGLVVGAESMFAWYWLADLCEDHSIPLSSAMTRSLSASCGRSRGSTRSRA